MIKHPECVFRVPTNLPFGLRCNVSIFAVKVLYLCKHECLRTQKVFFFHVNSIFFLGNLENSLLHNECAACLWLCHQTQQSVPAGNVLQQWGQGRSN